MPVSWLLLHVASLMAMQSQGASPPKNLTFSDITVSYRSGHQDLKTGAWSFDDGVVLKYEVTTIHADHLVIEPKTKHGLAKGHVHVDDPTATIDSAGLEVWWDPANRHGYVQNAILHIGTAIIRAGTVDIQPKLWTITDAYGTTSRANPPWYAISSPKVTIVPGKRGRMKHPTLYILGRKIYTFPDRNFSLDPRSEGLGFPGFNYRAGQGFGPSWSGGLLLNNVTDFAFGFSAFPQAYPTYGASVTRVLLPDEKVTTLITPASELSERFSFAYLENINVTSPEMEERNIQSSRKSIGFDTGWNEEANGRGIGIFYDKAAEGVYEYGTRYGNFGFVTQSRIQEIRQLGEPFLLRSIVSGAVSLPEIHLAPHLQTLSRIDTSLYAGANAFGWIRGSAGLVYRPIKQVALSAGAFLSSEAGNPDYIIDRLVSKDGMVFRADLNLGPTKVSYMTKYDISLKWFDHEYSISQVVGCFQPFLTYREYPAEYALGLRLNIDDLMNLITSRNFDRPQSSKSVISPTPNGKP